MNQATLWIRRLPIALFAILGGTALILCNPGYFWDDWVWIFKDSTETIRIGKELGIWWGGYVTSFINALSSPSLAMRGIALVGWVISGAAFAYVLYRRKRLSGAEAFELFLLYCAAHVALIRFLTSVAFYNVYIASFWIGAAVFVANTDRRRAILFSIPFFFFSFYLNSLLLLYGLLFAFLLYEDRRGWLVAPGEQVVADDAWTLRWAKHRLIGFINRYRPHLLAFMLRHVLLIALPFIFMMVKRITRVQSPLYDSYNEIVRSDLLGAIAKSFTLIVPVMRDYFASHTPAPLIIGGTVIAFALLQLLPRLQERRSLKFIVVQFVLGMLFFAAATYPYIVVGKTPDLKSFYESRHILPAVAALVLLILSLINLIDLTFSKWRMWRFFGRNLLVAYVVGASLGAGVNVGSQLWRDFFRQTAIMDFVKAHESELKDTRTFVFYDQSAGTRIGNRMIWNYEYTGYLITVYGTRDRFGVSAAEYAGWGPGVPLLWNSYLRQRFNIADYDFKKQHAIITVNNGFARTRTVDVLDVVMKYLRGDNWRYGAEQFTTISLSYERIQAEDRIREMYEIAKQLAHYKQEHGAYPAQVPPATNGTPYQQVMGEKIMPALVHGDIPGLFPQYMARPAAMQPGSPGAPEYLYLSDGEDYKLIYANPPDYAYAKQAHPALIDQERGAYGIWTSGARLW
ncbi:hypothetical protein [Pandoraea sp. ISTKB]|uniref:hypothetical protein n=1 Tax=Pandoraea sp. ISTKB TaxID=1586708 RepID=UPI0008472A62|nr:hypothetical protein [Pandoraea sp. ISTKB]ODP31257.1 hypothetical protein A9762_07545 [Pandoraea sp. ISTKB]